VFPRQNLRPCNVERTGGFEASLRLVQIVVVVPGEEIDEAGGREEWQARHLRRLMAVGKPVSLITNP